MLGDIIKLSVLGAILHFVIEYRVWLDWDKKIIVKNRPGPCRTVQRDGGSEDLTYIGDQTVIFSTGYGSPQGGINAIDLNDSTVFEVNVTNPPMLEDFLLNAHGISVWTDPITGHMTLFVLTHPEKGDRVEVFDILKPLALKHRKSITDVKFGNMNDLVAIDADRFYITKIFHYRDRNRYVLEFYGRLRFGTVMFYDGFKSRDVVSNLFMPNGINISPDKQVIYVAEFGAKKLLGYRRDRTNNLAKIWEMDMDTGIDNIEVESGTGNLWIGCHPLMWARMDVYNWFSLVPPSQVLYLKMSDNMVESISEIYVDDGSEAIGTSSATLVNGQLVIGTVEDQTLVCDTNLI